MTSAEAARTALLRLGVRDPEVKHVRTGSNALFNSGEMAVRVSDPGYDLVSLYEQADLSDHLVGQHFPTPRRLSPVMEVDGHLVTCWQWVPAVAEPQDRDVGALLGRFHEVGADYPGRTPDWAPQVRAQARIDESLVDVDARDRSVLEEELGLLLEQVGDADLGPEGLIHGDVHAGNVIASGQGCQLIDFERFCRGPVEWDLTQPGAKRRFLGGGEADWQAFLRGYGHIELSTHFELLVELRAFIMTTWLLTLEPTPAIMREREVRLDYWRQRAATGTTPTTVDPWSPI